MKILSLILLSIIITGCSNDEIKKPVFEKTSSVDFLVETGDKPSVKKVLIGGTKKLKLGDGMIQVRVKRYGVAVRDNGMIFGGWQTLGDTKSIIDYDDQMAIENLRLRDRWKFINHNMNTDLVKKEANINNYYKHKISGIKTDIHVDDKIEILGNMEGDEAQRLIQKISTDSLKEVCKENIVGMNSHVNWFDKEKVLSVIGRKYNSIKKYQQFDITVAQKEYSNAVGKYYALLKNEYSGVVYEVEKVCTPRNSTTVRNESVVSYGISHRNPEKSIYLKDTTDVVWNADITIDSISLEGHALNTTRAMKDDGIEISIGSGVLTVTNVNNNVIKLKDIMYYFDGVARLIDMEAVLLPKQSYTFDMKELAKGGTYIIEKWDGKASIKSGMKINYEIGSNTKVSKFNLDTSVSMVWSEYFN